MKTYLLSWMLIMRIGELNATIVYSALRLTCYILSTYSIISSSIHESISLAWLSLTFYQTLLLMGNFMKETNGLSLKLIHPISQLILTHEEIIQILLNQSDYENKLVRPQVNSQSFFFYVAKIGTGKFKGAPWTPSYKTYTTCI